MIFCIDDLKFKINIMIISHEYLHNDLTTNLDFDLREYPCVQYLNIVKSAEGKRLLNSSIISSRNMPYGLYPLLAASRMRLYLEFNSLPTASATSENAVFIFLLYREILPSPETCRICILID